MPFQNDTNIKRVTSMVATLALIQVSGKSNRATGDDYADLLMPVLDKIGGLLGAHTTVNFDRDKPQPDPVPERTAPDPSITKPIRKEMDHLEELSTQQLVDQMIACGAILAKRRQ